MRENTKKSKLNILKKVPGGYIVITCICILAIAGWMVFKPIKNYSKEVADKISEYKQNLEQHSEIAMQSDILEKSHKDIRILFDKATSFIPENDISSKVVGFAEETAEEIGLKITVNKNQTKDTLLLLGKSFNLKGIRVSMEGTYENVLTWIAKIETSLFPIEISNMSINSTNSDDINSDSNMVSADFEIKIYTLEKES